MVTAKRTGVAILEKVVFIMVISKADRVRLGGRTPVA